MKMSKSIFFVGFMILAKCVCVCAIVHNHSCLVRTMFSGGFHFKSSNFDFFFKNNISFTICVGLVRRFRSSFFSLQQYIHEECLELAPLSCSFLLLLLRKLYIFQARNACCDDDNHEIYSFYVATMTIGQHTYIDLFMHRSCFLCVLDV